VELTTIHGAKGREWDRVILVPTRAVAPRTSWQTKAGSRMRRLMLRDAGEEKTGHRQHGAAPRFRRGAFDDLRLTSQFEEQARQPPTGCGRAAASYNGRVDSDHPKAPGMDLPPITGLEDTLQDP
jgi:hypothetical protein